ncbi:hypothetical protein [Oligoflexus sp.]|uniref:hypothetical protein n=1 Tax=Oligoflexus sp. TaxID=1971216 RepID=UPI002D7657BE|nr:hypothetical protein [Oligoflexus sp.]
MKALLQKISSIPTRDWSYSPIHRIQGVVMALSFKGRHFEKSIILYMVPPIEARETVAMEERE